MPGRVAGTVMISDPEGNVVASFPGEGWLAISWSPDSTRVAVWVSWGETIGVYGLDGVRQTMLTVPPGWMADGRLRPGVVAGRRIAPGPPRRGDPPRRKRTSETPVG